MSSFRDALSADAEDVFLSLDDFADEHTFMGQKVKAVIEEAHDSLDNASKDDFVDATALAIISQRLTVRIKSGVLTRLPVPEEDVVLDGLRYQVEKVTPQFGMNDITLTRSYA
nr:MAG TPA: ATP-binding sugar transporter [Caudoviricetes sp.]